MKITIAWGNRPSGTQVTQPNETLIDLKKKKKKKKTQHNSNITWVSMCFRSPCTWFFSSTTYSGLLQRQQPVKLCITGPLWGKSTSDPWIPLSNGQWCRKHFQIMISSWQQTFYPGVNEWNAWSPHRCTGVYVWTPHKWDHHVRW